jgi:hypothetical protein
MRCIQSRKNIEKKREASWKELFTWLRIFHGCIYFMFPFIVTIEQSQKTPNTWDCFSHRQQISLSQKWIGKRGGKKGSFVGKLSISRRKLFCWKSIFFRGYFSVFSHVAVSQIARNFPRLFGCSHNFHLHVFHASRLLVMKIYDHSFGCSSVL